MNSNPMNSSVNKPNAAALVTIVLPMVVWALNRFVLTTPLTEGEVAMVTSGIAGAAAWISVYFVPNNPPAPGDPPPPAEEPKSRRTK